MVSIILGKRISPKFRHIIDGGNHLIEGFLSFCTSSMASAERFWISTPCVRSCFAVSTINSLVVFVTVQPFQHALLGCQAEASVEAVLKAVTVTFTARSTPRMSCLLFCRRTSREMAPDRQRPAAVGDPSLVDARKTALLPPKISSACRPSAGKALRPAFDPWFGQG